MSTEIASVLQSYIIEGERLLAELESSRMSVRNIGRDVTKDVLSEMAGAIVSEITGTSTTGRYTKKYSKKLLDAQQKAHIQTVERNLFDKSNIWLENIKRFLSSVSVRRANLRYPGNSHLLVRKLDRIYRNVRPDTRIRSTISILQTIAELPLIHNRDVPQVIQREKPKRDNAYEMLKRLETRLRECIQTSLGKVSKNRWKERVPEDVQDRARLRKERNEKQWPWHADKELPLIFYVDFTDYAKIITRRDNWEQVFKQIFREKNIILAKFRELEPIRNAVAHMRDLSQHQLEKLKLYSEDMVLCTEKRNAPSA